MADYLTNTTELTAVADAIREKTGDEGNLIFPNGFVNAIGEISSGASSYNITINLTNPINTSHFDHIDIYAIVDDTRDSVGMFENLEFIQQILNPSSSTVVTLEASYFGIEIDFNSEYLTVPDVITTGKVTAVSNRFALHWYLVGSDCTLTFNNVDYYDDQELKGDNKKCQ